MSKKLHWNYGAKKSSNNNNKRPSAAVALLSIWRIFFAKSLFCLVMPFDELCTVLWVFGLQSFLTAIRIWHFSWAKIVSVLKMAGQLAGLAEGASKHWRRSCPKSKQLRSEILQIAMELGWDYGGIALYWERFPRWLLQQVKELELLKLRNCLDSAVAHLLRAK